VFSLNLLGGIELSSPSGPVTGRAAQPRRLALLAVLAIARERPVGRERLIGLLWPEHSPGAARHALTESLHVLRSELSGDLFISLGDGLALNPAVVESDFAKFEEAVEGGRLEDAVRTYRGPFLDGFYVRGAAEFERWADGERDRLARLYARSLEELAVADEARGDFFSAAERWRQLVIHDPYSTRAALQLMQALDSAGERPEALHVGTAHVALLREDLGIEPNVEVTQTLERLRGEPSRVVPDLPPPERVPPPPPPPRRNPSPPHVFISYSQKDRRWLERLQIHLKPLEREAIITRWDDTLIEPGTQWQPEITRALSLAKVAVLLISADFLASDYVRNNELPPLLDAAREAGTTILPLILSPCRFAREESLAKFQAVNNPERPLNSLTKAKQEKVFDLLCESIEKTLRS